VVFLATWHRDIADTTKYQQRLSEQSSIDLPSTTAVIVRNIENEDLGDVYIEFEVGGPRERLGNISIPLLTGNRINLLRIHRGSPSAANGDCGCLWGSSDDDWWCGLWECPGVRAGTGYVALT
jgi:hypothetical protein